MDKLASIISPCYNGEKYLIPFMESILNQDYSNIELIMVDDGSTDNSKDIILSYEDKIKNKGYRFKYIYQNNAGAAAAINQGLKVFEGDYLMWVDSDDVLFENNVSEKVEYLENNKDCGFVLAQGIVVSETDYNKEIGRLQRICNPENDTLFQDLIYERNVVFCPGVIMATREAILKSIPTKHIYESRQGQNWQLMLPLAYYFKCGYINKPLFKCVSHMDSHSRQRRTKEEQINRINEFVELLTNTIDSIVDMPKIDKDIWKSKVEEKYMHRRLMLYYANKQWNCAKSERINMKKNGYYTHKDTYFYFIMRAVYIKLKRVLRKII